MKKILPILLLCIPVLLLAQEKAYLGVYSNHVSKKKAKKLGFENPYGSYVTRIIPNTAAEQSGMKVFDYIYAIGGEEFSEDRNFSHALRDYQPGSTAELSFIRNGVKQSKTITFGERADANYRHRSDDEDPFLGVHQTHSNVPDNVDGVPITIISSDCSTAKELGLKPNDVITYIDNTPILDWHDLTAGIDNRSVGDPIAVTYYRDGTFNTVEAPIKSQEATHDCPEEDEEEVLPVATETEEEIEDEILALEEELEVSMENVSEQEAENMKEQKGIDMPIVNNLQIEQLNVFPNPTSGAFQLRFELPETGNTSIRIFNSAARLIYQNDLGQFTGDFSDRVDIGTNPAGTYFVEIRQDNKSVSKKLILKKL
jgi:PDZ domain-containing secreted protein